MLTSYINAYCVLILRLVDGLRLFLSMIEYFPPSLPLTLSVVSMELLSPHKMAEIKQSRVPTETEKLGK